MKIEVAVHPSASKKEKGDLLENLAEKLLIAQSYKVVKEVRQTGVELDLLCEHKISNKEIYVECKAYRDSTIDANILKNLVGTQVLNGYEECWLISTGEYGKEAKGFIQKWKNKPKEMASKLSFYGAAEIIDSLVNSNIIKTPPIDAVTKEIGINSVGEWVLLVTKFGNFWTVPVLSSGIPKSVICYHANTNDMVEDIGLLEKISSTDTSLSGLEFRSLELSEISSNQFEQAEVIDVVQVQTGEEWTDYRPARPQDFVGRSKDIAYIFNFFKRIINKETTTRIFALTGDSGMGKSSLVAKITSKAHNKHNKNKYFILSVDVRAATTPSYISSSLLECLKRAQKKGFGDQGIKLSLSVVGNPLASETVKKYLESVKQQNRLIILIFDQFEELYSKPELSEVFNRTKLLLLNAAAITSNFCLGFAWKSDSTTPSDHPAYFFWHQLSDYRIEKRLSPFSDKDSLTVLNKFEKVIGQKLNNDLRHNLIVSSQGYPWLLKKLCIHLYGKIQDGSDQKGLIENKLDVSSLFNSDLQLLNPSELKCLEFIAQRAPVDWHDVFEISGAETIKSLTHRRLIVRSGDRLNIYWDTFREYILTKKVPIIALRYLPSSEFVSIMRVVKVLQEKNSLTVQEMAEILNLSEGTVQNICTDINMFDLASRQSGTYTLNLELQNYDENSFLEHIREKFKRHAFTLALKERTSSSSISINDAILVLQAIYHSSSYEEKTWRSYTLKLCRWLELCGFLVPITHGWIYRDLGYVISEGERKLLSSRKSNKVFTAPSTPTTTLSALEWVISKKEIDKKESLPKGYRNALQVLVRFGLVEVTATHFIPNNSVIAKYESLPKAILHRAHSEVILREIMSKLKSNKEISGRIIGEYVKGKHGMSWSSASVNRTGYALRQWGEWMLEM